MKNKDYAHLHVHTTYSQLDGYGLPEEYAKRARRLGFKYLACTDHGNIDALIKFQNACKKYDIVPILGCEAYIVSEWKKDRARGHITIWVKNQRGFKNLCSMLSAANLHGFYYKPRIDFKTFLKHKKGLCVGTACLQSFVNSQNGRKFFNQLHDGIGDDLYCEIMPHDMRHQIRHNRKVIKLAKKTGIKVIATNDCHYIKKSDHRVQEVMLAIQRKTTWNDENRWSFDITGLHLKHANERKMHFGISGSIRRNI
jgi:DNA polymerase-3 subunit alpha